ncbi:MAG: hypothetical protein KGY68_07925 [Candidatus Thermoplasmatota archaeon]|nr:hypothetical protein [Candidatus Thermoplasmatota archaeon]
MVRSDLIERIEKIEQEVELLKKDLKKKPVKMKGRLEGLKVEETDLEEAKESLFKTT